MKNKDIDLWPIAIIQDRYNGVYSGGSWLAIAECDKWEGTRREEQRVDFCLNGGPHGDDTTASIFGHNIPNLKWIAVGNTPDEALNNLKAKN